MGGLCLCCLVGSKGRAEEQDQSDNEGFQVKRHWKVAGWTWQQGWVDDVGCSVLVWFVGYSSKMKGFHPSKARKHKETLEVKGGKPTRGNGRQGCEEITWGLVQFTKKLFSLRLYVVLLLGNQGSSIRTELISWMRNSWAGFPLPLRSCKEVVDGAKHWNPQL